MNKAVEVALFLHLLGVAVWVGRRTARSADYRPAALRARRLWLAGGGQ